MNCTNCNNGILKPSTLEENLPVHTCTNCEGNWILIEDYIIWSKRYPNHEFSVDASFKADLSDTKKALICPASGAIMTKLHISENSEHRLDYSTSVGGIWLDNGEWELLKAEELADSLNVLVTRERQNQIKDNATELTFSKLYQRKFGVDSYAKIKEIRDWLQNQSDKPDLTAYLLARNPYSAKR